MREPGELTRPLAEEAQTRRAGAELAAALVAVDPPALFVTLAGELGAGKTTLVRGLLEALGVTGPVRSPTYTLIETYPAAGRRLHHLDWYRLGGTEDLEGVGFRELLAPGNWVFVEWPERAAAVAEQADLTLRLAYLGTGRQLAAVAMSPPGRAVLRRWRAGIA